MRQLTFQGYLAKYVQYLAGKHTLSLRELAQAAKDNPRLREPLALWAATKGRTEAVGVLLGPDQELTSELQAIATLVATGDLEEALANETDLLPLEYHKVWRSYVARRDAYVRDAKLKRAVRARVLELQTHRTVTRYRMAKDLGLNHGNLHAFLTQGNVSKLSLDRAYALVDYLESAQPRERSASGVT